MYRHHSRHDRHLLGSDEVKELRVEVKTSPSGRGGREPPGEGALCW
jgi:hypothetical protein